MTLRSTATTRVSWPTWSTVRAASSPTPARYRQGNWPSAQSLKVARARPSFPRLRGGDGGRVYEQGRFPGDGGSWRGCGRPAGCKWTCFSRGLTRYPHPRHLHHHTIIPAGSLTGFSADASGTAERASARPSLSGGRRDSAPPPSCGRVLGISACEGTESALALPRFL